MSGIIKNFDMPDETRPISNGMDKPAVGIDFRGGAMYDKPQT
jgi:hypothetical protein